MVKRAPQAVFDYFFGELQRKMPVGK